MAKLVTRTTDATSEPLTAAEMRAHLRITQTDEDSQLETYIKAARIYLEDTLGVSFLRVTWTAYWEDFTTPLVIPRRPYSSVTSLKYTDEDGNATTLTENTDFIVDSQSVNALIKPAEDQTWPSDVEGDAYNAVTLVFVAGHATTAAIPPPWIQSLRLLVELMAERYGPLADKAFMDMPHNSVRAMIGAYVVPNV